MTGTSKLSQIFVDLAVQLPFAIAIVVCMIVMIRRRKRHPKVAVWALIGLALILLNAITFTFIYALVPDLFSSTNRSYVLQFLGVIFNVTRVIAYAPLLAAIFMQRPVREFG